MKLNLFKGKSARTKVFMLITAGALIVLLALNFLLTFLTQKNALYIDMTPESLYSLSDKMKEECAFIDELDDGDKEIKITFCADPDTLAESTVTRVVYFMALCMQREFDNLSVETVNVIYNPTAVAKYKATSLTEIEPTDVIVSYGNVFRIVSAESFWMKFSNQTYFSFDGEYKLASLIMSVTAINKPVAYFTTGHGELYYDAANPGSEGSVKTEALYNLLSERGFKIGLLDLTKDDIPEDCAVLIINNPKSDFEYDPSESGLLSPNSETRKIDRYLRKNQGALMVARDYEAENLTNLDSFLYEWGFKFSDSKVTDTDNHVGGNPNIPSQDIDKIIGVYESNTNSYANVLYGEFATLPSAPPTVFVNTGYIECSFYETDTRSEEGCSNQVTITYAPFMTSHDTAVATTKDGIAEKDGEMLDLAAVSVRMDLDPSLGKNGYSYVFCANSSEFFSNDLLDNNSYANFDIVSALVNNISRVDLYASLELGGSSMNSDNYGGKQLVYDTLSEKSELYYNGDGSFKGSTKGLTTAVKVVAIIIAVIVPLVPLAVCIVIKIKRKYL